MIIDLSRHKFLTIFDNLAIVRNEGINFAWYALPHNWKKIEGTTTNKTSSCCLKGVNKKFLFSLQAFLRITHLHHRCKMRWFPLTLHHAEVCEVNSTNIFSVGVRLLNNATKLFPVMGVSYPGLYIFSSSCSANTCSFNLFLSVKTSSISAFV